MRKTNEGTEKETTMNRTEQKNRAVKKELNG